MLLFNFVCKFQKVTVAGLEQRIVRVTKPQYDMWI